VNIITGDGETGAALVASDVDKIAFTGSTEVGRIIREQTAGSGKTLTLELGGKSPYIVFDDTDLDSAVEGLVDAIWFNQGQVCCAGSRLLVHEPIADRFYAKLKKRMQGLRIGDPLDKCIDIGAIIDTSQRDMIAAMVDANSEGETFQTAAPEGCFYPPTLITGLHTSSHLMQTEIFGPVLVSTTFRTPSEAVEIANNTRYGLAATVWSENINLALDIAPKLVAGIVWINGTNMMDAAAGFGGVRESGFGREGGWEGLAHYTKPKATAKPAKPIAAYTGNGAPTDTLDRTAKLYIGGKQARPDGGYSAPVFGPKGALLGQVSQSNRKDVRNAVEAMNAAKNWSKTTAHLRAQILYYIGENLSARADEFAARLNAMRGGKAGAAEVDAAINALFTYAAWADKLDGATKPVPLRGTALAMNEAVGNIAVLCNDSHPLLGLVTPMAAALAMGNRVTLHASPVFPLAATDFIQVLETSDTPSGTVNILTGPQGGTAKHMAAHMDIDALWSFSESYQSADLETASISNLKRTWITQLPKSAKSMLSQATDIKTVWIPYGE
jgi:aldehyde dehydrogenase (NAD+)